MKEAGAAAGLTVEQTRQQQNKALRAMRESGQSTAVSYVR
ncbi:hypothetical protein [Ruminococcus sp. 5_1_39BFAA]